MVGLKYPRVVGNNGPLWIPKAFGQVSGLVSLNLEDELNAQICCMVGYVTLKFGVLMKEPAKNNL